MVILAHPVLKILWLLFNHKIDRLLLTFSNNQMSRVFVLSTGCAWEQFYILGVFSSKVLAINFCKEHMRKQHDCDEDYDKATKRCIKEFNSGIDYTTHIKNIYSIENFTIDKNTYK